VGQKAVSSAHSGKVEQGVPFVGFVEETHCGLVLKPTPGSAG
jgi:hypothetical protein